MSSPRITFIHGWGYDATLWRRVVALLPDCDVELCDLGGFGGRPVLPAATAAPRIAVGHSLGVLWWLALAEAPWHGLVAINGFPRFTAAADFPHGVPMRVLDRMRKRFTAAPATVLADFRAACGDEADAPPSLPQDTGPLATGLAQLATVDGRAALLRRRADVWALAARDDAIVPADMSAAAFATLPPGRLRWIDDGGHLLPLTRPQACADLIREAAR